MTLTVPCLFGLESLVADEMRRLDLKNVRAENGRVHCEGTLADIARLNINLRCGARVLMELGSFPARDFEALFQGVYALPWEDYIPRDGEFPVKGYSLNSQLHSVPACQSIVKKASAKRLGEKYGVETLPESGSRYQIQFSIIKDVATLYLDTSGEGLYKRGYRAKNMGAPLRETLAAALVPLSRYRGKDPFCDPFCGSGTIPIEAALIAKNRAPGLDRSFAAQKWKNMDSKLWLEAGERPEHAVALCAVIAEIRQRNIPAQRPHGTEEGGGGLVGRHAERLLRRPPRLPAGYAVCLHAVRPDRIAEQPQGVQRQPDVGCTPDLPGQAQGAVPAQVGQGKQQSRNELTADVAGKAEGIRMQTAPHRDACFRPCEEHTLRPADVLIHGQRACK